MAAFVGFALLPACMYDDIYSPPYSSRPLSSYGSHGHYSPSYGRPYRSSYRSRAYDPHYDCPLARQRERDRARERERERERERQRERDRRSSSSGGSGSSSAGSSSSSSGGGHPRRQATQERRADLDERRARGEATSRRAARGR